MSTNAAFVWICDVAIHTFRITLAQRSNRHTGKTRAPRLSYAAALIHKLTGINHSRCIALVNEGRTFQCEFRKIVQNTDAMLDYGYRIYYVSRNTE
jgi:hypothetical protein